MYVAITPSSGIELQLIQEIQLSLDHVALLMGENSSILILFVSYFFFFVVFYKEDIVCEVEKYNWSTDELKMKNKLSLVFLGTLLFLTETK